MSPLEIIILLPLLAAIAIWLGAPGRATAMGASVVNLLLVLGLFIHYRGAGAGTMAYTSSHQVLSSPQIAFAVGADGVSLTMALLTVLVTLAAVWATSSKERLHYGSSLLISCGALGAFLCTDIFFLYAFHELALIPTFLMIALYGHGDKRQAAWRITIYLGVGSLVLLAGLLAVVWYCRPAGGELTFDLLTLLKHPLKGDVPYASFAPTIFFVLLVGFGTLVSLFPFHSWAAPAYASAPTPVAMLHSGVLKKFGLYGLIRIALPLLPDATKTPWVQDALLYMLLGNILIIGFVTLYQSRLDTMLANSSVMHMGYIFLGLAAGNAIGINGAVLLMFGHGISVALLFMICGRLRNQLGTLEFDKLGGLAKNAPFLSLVFGIAAFASIGLPGLANFAGEAMIFFSTFESFRPAEGFTFLQVATICSLWGVVISAVYMLRAYRKLFFGQAASGLYVSDPGLGLRVPMILLAVALFVVGVYPGSLLQVINASLEYAATLAVK